MTQINKLILDGFKSFGKRTELVFGERFNVILGPNGSGKSNVLDALCFVLGKTSAKSMRAEKSANLIYNGGKAKKPAKQAEVSIVFDNGAKTFPTPEKEVKISRIVRTDGSSKYKINGKTRTRQEILDLLSIAKIDPDGYNIILQGDVIRFCDMSANERRQKIEEVAGISVYEERKNKALRELEKVDEKLQQAQIILKERESYLKDLEKDRDQALKFKKLTDKLRQNQATFLKKRIDKRAGAKEKLTKQTDERKRKFDGIIAKVNSLREDIDSKRDAIKDISHEVESKGEKEQIDLQKSIEQLRIDIATGQTRIAGLNKEIANIDQRRELVQSDLGQLKEKREKLEHERMRLEKSKVLNEKTSKELEAKIAAFKKKHKIDRDTQALEKELDQIDSKSDELSKALQSFRESQQELLRQKDRLEFQVQAIDGQIAKVKELENEHKEEISQLKQMKKDFKQTILELNQLLNLDSKLAAQTGQLRGRLQQVKEKIAALEVESAQAREAMSGSIAVKKVLENASSLGQVYGTVAELGSVDEKYATALEMAGAKKINSVVVEDDKTAAKCIRFLKEQRLGTAAFLPLNKIRAPSFRLDRSKLKVKGVHGRAIDLVEFEPKFKEVFKYVFGETLVVDDIAAARRIGIGTCKMATLDGDIAEASGAMIGGFRQKKKGVFKGKSIDKELDKLHAREAQMSAEIAQIDEKKAQNEERIQRLRQHKAELEGEIIKREKSLHLDSSDLEANKKYKQDLKKKMEGIERSLDEIGDSISEKNQELAQLKSRKARLRESLSQLKNPRLIAELNTFEAKKKQLAEEQIVVTVDLKNLDEKIREVSRQEQGASEKGLEELDAQKKGFQKELAGIEKSIAGKARELKKKEKEQVQAQSRFKALFEKRNKLSDEITVVEKKIFKLEDDSRKEELKINTLSIELAKVDTELSALEAEFGQFEGVELVMNKSEEQLKKEISAAEKLKSNIGSVNMKALEIYEAVEKEYRSLIEKKDQLFTEKGDVVHMLDEIESQKTELFTKTLDLVREHFQAIFSSLTTKGEAELVLESPEKPFEGGLLIRVRLSGNKFLDIRSLSGGEKTMTALAFIFAIQEHAPATFYVLDEVDAALDKRNSEKLAKLVRKYCDRAQYVVISHNDAVITEGDSLYGVSMNEHGVSNVVSIKV